MNEIAEKLGEVGLPEPVSELAKRDWDAIVVGGGHNGLTAAAYLARAGKSVLVLERRERLGGAATLERPFSDDRYVVSPCAYVVGLLDQLVIDELDLHKRGLRYWVADPNLWVPFDDGSAFAQWLDEAKTQASLERLGVSKKDIDGYWAYEELFDDVRKLLRKGDRDTWVGDTPTRDEIEDLLGGSQEMIDLVFNASIADVLDAYIDDERLKTALFGQGIIGTWGGPYEPGTASIKLMHYQGDLDGQGPVWGYVEGGMGMCSFAIADAAAEYGAVLACGVPVSRITPGRGRHARGRHRAAGRHRDLQRRPEADGGPARRHRGRRGLPRAARRVEDPQPGRQVQRPARPAAELDRGAGGELARPGDGRRHRHDGRGAGRVRALRGRRARGRLRRDLHPDRLRPEPGSGGQAPAERLRPVRAVRHRRVELGRGARRRRQAVHRPDLALRPRLPAVPGRARGARPAGHRVADRPHRRQHLPGRGDPGPDVGGQVRRADPGRGPLHVRRRHPPGGQRDRAQRPQRRLGGAGRPGRIGRGRERGPIRQAVRALCGPPVRSRRRDGRYGRPPSSAATSSSRPSRAAPRAGRGRRPRRRRPSRAPAGR